MNSKPLFPILLAVFLSAGIICSPLFISAQDMKKGIEYKYDVKKYVRSDRVVWYGWDFSKSRMMDPAKIEDAELIKTKYIPGISERLNKRVTPDQIQQKLKKDLSVDLTSVQDLYKGIRSEEFITKSDYTLPVEGVKELVKSYNLPQQEGTGLVVILELMHKTSQSDRYVTGYVTFFDIKTKEVLWTTKMKGQPGSKYGFAMYWLEGIREIYDCFMSKYYGKTVRQAQD